MSTAGLRCGTMQFYSWSLGRLHSEALPHTLPW